MRTLLVALAASAAVVCILSSFAQQTSTSNDKSAAKEPTSDQLLNVPVGGYVIGGAAPPVANPYEGNKEAIAKGRQLFDAMNCSGCHAPEAGGGMGPPLGDADWIYGSQPGDIFLTIKQGRPNGMPSFQGLPNEVIWQLTAYVSSLSANRRK
jgi:cytochrome c oxidase cbb3-type subunit 3